MKPKGRPYMEDPTGIPPRWPRRFREAFLDNVWREYPEWFEKLHKENDGVGLRIIRFLPEHIYWPTKAQTLEEYEV